METGGVDSGLRRQRRKSCDEIQLLEDHVGGAVAIRVFQSLVPMLGGEFRVKSQGSTARIVLLF